MWIRLGNEYLNLSQVLRVRFNRGWKNGNEELVAEVEALIRGEVQVFTRYRGADATALHAIVGAHAGVPEPVAVPAGAPDPIREPFALSASMRGTLAEI